MCPKPARCAHSGLDLIDDHKDAELVREFAQGPEEGRACVLVASLGGDGLHDETGNGRLLTPGNDRLFDLRQCGRLGLCILSSMLC